MQSQARGLFVRRWVSGVRSDADHARAALHYVAEPEQTAAEVYGLRMAPNRLYVMDEQHSPRAAAAPKRPKEWANEQHVQDPTLPPLLELPSEAEEQDMERTRKQPPAELKAYAVDGAVVTELNLDGSPRRKQKVWSRCLHVLFACASLLWRCPTAVCAVPTVHMPEAVLATGAQRKGKGPPPPPPWAISPGRRRRAKRSGLQWVATAAQALLQRGAVLQPHGGQFEICTPRGSRRK